MAHRVDAEVERVARQASTEESTALMIEHSPFKIPKASTASRINDFLISLVCGVLIGGLATFSFHTGAACRIDQSTPFSETPHSNVNPIIAGEFNGLIPKRK